MLGQTESPPREAVAADPSRRLNHAVWVVCEATGDIIEFWGFKRVLGRIWALLYLAAEPLSAGEIGSHLGLSTGAVSMALKELEQWGVITRESRPSIRQFYYRAETHLWSMLSRVVRSRELHQLERLIHALKVGAEALEAAKSGETSVIGDHAAAKTAAQRLKRLSRLVEMGSEAMRMLFQDRQLDLAAQQKIAQIRNLFQEVSKP